jgi:hypothetical protein
MGEAGRPKPGVENMLEKHAPMPLAPRVLDMRNGHPAASKDGVRTSQARFSRLDTTFAVLYQARAIVLICKFKRPPAFFTSV